uniref:Retrovirus-related Pol polyprotein from transposon TNT 1-94 n=1 Tax=Cajanus cajan TaxID=3821 RepID=A0A151RHL4_CAJCA|nr:Retrovirus-related Pol polyprotein from transposon TNT 1-94 [Cajanus cajan]
MATEGAFIQPAVPRFDGHYDHWAMLMENFLRSKEYWGVVENGVSLVAEGVTQTEAQKKICEEQKLKDLKAKNYLFQALDRSILETIINKDTSKSIWDSMKKKYQGTTRVKRANLQALRKEYEIAHMKEGESVNEYIARILVITNKMKANGEDLKDFAIVEKILRSMTPKFNYVVCSIEESKDTSMLSLDELQSSLLVHEQRMSNTVHEEQALKVTHGNQYAGRGRGRGGFGGRGRGRNGQNFNKATVESFACHKLGHFQWECNKGVANFAESQVESEEHMLLMAYVEEIEQHKTDMWFLDSGCSNHMCGKREYFSDLDENFTDLVKLGNNSNIVVNGKGNIRLKIDGIISIISGVFYVLELKNNLLSLGQLQEKGLSILFQQGHCKIYHPDKGLIMKANMFANRMFILHSISLPISSTCFKIATEDVAHLWHCRFGHLSFKGLQTLQQKEMVKGLPLLKSPSKLCKDCIAGKQHRDSFPIKSSWRASQILQLVHADICGPIKPASNSNKRYLITFIDDFSQKNMGVIFDRKIISFCCF